MRRVVDVSDYQAGLDLDTVASCVDGAWFKVGDWSWIAGHGWPGDDIHDAGTARFLQLGKPVGSYMFVRPGSTSPATQIDWWAQHCAPNLTMKPMIDLEVSTISGDSLRGWIEEAITLVSDRFGVDKPVLYWSNAFANGHGMSAPRVPHIPMVAEYHRGYNTALWQNVNDWENWAYSLYGGPDVPPGYSGYGPRDLIWQFTSSAQIPGFSGLVDCDFVPDARWAELTAAGGGTGDDNDLMSYLSQAQQFDLANRIEALYHIMADAPADSTSSRWAVQEARINQLHGELTGRAVGDKVNMVHAVLFDDGGRWGRLWTAADAVARIEPGLNKVREVTERAHQEAFVQETGREHGRNIAMDAAAEREAAAKARVTLDKLAAKVDKLAVGGGSVDVDALVAAVSAGVLKRIAAAFASLGQDAVPVADTAHVDPDIGPVGGRAGIGADEES